MIKGLGIDISTIERFKNLKDRKEFGEDVFTPDELNTVKPTPASARVFALLFSIKEAFLKALRCGLHFGYFWRDIAVGPRLEVKASGRIRGFVEKLSVRQFHVSAAQTKRYAVGIVLLESEDQFQEVH
jgi:phosphopantetheine--protein transferase-like protein